MSAKPKQSDGCWKCAWASWEKAKTGRKALNGFGRCNAPIPDVEFPLCVTEKYGYIAPTAGERVFRGLGTKKNCPLWRPEEKA
jgi:hypothetical protein